VNESVVLTPTPVPFFNEDKDKISLETSDTEQSEFIPATDGWDIGLNYESGYDDWWKLVLIDQRTNEIAVEATPKQFTKSQIRLVLPWNEIWEWEEIFEWARSQGISESIPRFPQQIDSGAPDMSMSISYPIANQQVSGIQRIRLNNTYPEFSGIRLELSALGSNSWTLLGEQPFQTETYQGLDWDTQLFPDGYYRLRASILLPHQKYYEYQVPVTLVNGFSGLGPSIQITGIEPFSVVRGVSNITVELVGPDIRQLSIFIQSPLSESTPQLLTQMDRPGVDNAFPFNSSEYENGIYTLIFELKDASTGFTTIRLPVEINNLSR
jgi:hypothetical protein